MTEALSEIKHSPTLLVVGGCRIRRARCECSCGWRSEDYITKASAHLAFGRHLVEQPSH